MIGRHGENKHRHGDGAPPEERDSGGKTMGDDIGREEFSRSGSHHPPADEERDSAEGTMGVRLTIDGSIISTSS
jgi:hypothetical protein